LCIEQRSEFERPGLLLNPEVIVERINILKEKTNSHQIVGNKT
jgi:hypothetical protein